MSQRFIFSFHTIWNRFAKIGFSVITSFIAKLKVQEDKIFIKNLQIDSNWSEKCRKHETDDANSPPMVAAGFDIFFLARSHKRWQHNEFDRDQSTHFLTTPSPSSTMKHHKQPLNGSKSSYMKLIQIITCAICLASAGVFATPKFGTGTLASLSRAMDTHSCTDKFLTGT